MKLRNLFKALAAVAVLAVSCARPEANLSFPSIEVSKSEISVGMPAGTVEMQVTANRPWKATTTANWIAIDPDSGAASDAPQTVTITVLENTSYTRDAKVVFDIVYETADLLIAQDGNGSPEDYIIYSNDFDKETATQTFGSNGSSWPFLDQFEGWKNQVGVGTSSMEYEFSGLSVRNNSNSNGSYSDYPGSGLNNLLFGANGYLVLKNLSLNGFTDFKLSFGSEKYDNNDKTALFDPSEMKAYVSADGSKWVPVAYEYKGTAAGRWNLAEGTFSVPAGTASLYFYISASVASAYRLDDLRIDVSETPGDVLDFSAGEELTFGGSGSGSGGSGGGSSDYDNAPAKTVKEFIDAADTQTYFKLTGKVSNFNATYCSFDLTDDSGVIYVYSVDNKDQWSSKVKNGGTVTLAGKYLYYASKSQHEVVNAQILSFTEGESTGGSDDYANAPAKTVQQFIDAADTQNYYKLTGTVSGFNATYCSFDLTDASGKIYVYSVDNKADWSSKVQNGGTVTLAGKYSYYASKSQHEVVNAQILSFTPAEGGDPGTTPGPGEGGDSGVTVEGNTMTWIMGASKQSWSAATDATYGAGYKATSGGVTVAYYKHKSTTAPVDPKDDHIRVYKNSMLSIDIDGGRKIVGLNITCVTGAASQYCFDLNVSDGSVAKADTAAGLVTWSGEIDRFLGEAVNGQLRITAIKVIYK